MQRQTIRALCAMVLGLFAVGCGLFSDPVKDMEKSIGVPLQTKSVKVAAGTLTFFRYVKAGQCGHGVITDLHGARGGAGWGEGPCADATSLGAGAQNGNAGGGHTYALMYGEINDRRITKVIVTIEDQAEAVEAQVVDGWWYIFLDGRAAQARIQKVVGLDAGGTAVFP